MEGHKLELYSNITPYWICSSLKRLKYTQWRVNRQKIQLVLG
jgi:hypothetical protein